MTLTRDIAPEVEEALLAAARWQGHTPEEVVSDTLRSTFGPDMGRAGFVRDLFTAGAEVTRHVWDTPEEDAAWAHLQ